MKRIIRITGFLLVTILLIAMLPATVAAAETYGYEVAIVPSPVAIGSTVTLTFRLTDYTDAKSGIRGFQIDITDVDDVLHEAVCTSLVTDTDELLSNTAKYQSSRGLVRHAYAKMSGTMSYDDSDLLEVKFTIPETYTEAGTLSLPLKILIQNEAGDKLTYTDTIEISYVPAGDVPDKPPDPDDDIISVDVAWGNMEFAYTEGTWSTQTHTYEGTGWADNGSGYVTVTNSGTVNATATFAYQTERTDIFGDFFSDDGPISGAQDLSVGNSLTAHLVLSGKPSEYLGEGIVIGTVTVTIGGE